MSGRLATVAVVLRELAHGSAGRLALEPRFEVKAMLASHLYDDASATAALGLPAATAPAPDVAVLLDRAAAAADPADHLAIVYGEIKPALVATLHAELEGADPRADEPAVRLLIELVNRQERHVAELGEAPRPAPEALAPMPGGGEPRVLPLLPPLQAGPARDGYVEVVGVAGQEAAGPDEPGRLTHARLHTALWTAELAGRTSHEHPELPFDQHLDLARRAIDAVHEAERADALMTAELDTHWGAHPVDFAAFRSAYARDVAGRLQALDESAVWRARG